METLRAKWIADEGRCQAVTHRGRQCRYPCYEMGRTVCSEDDFELVEFVPGETDRCYLHRVSVLVEKAADPNCHDATIENLLPVFQREQ